MTVKENGVPTTETPQDKLMLKVNTLSDEIGKYTSSAIQTAFVYGAESPHIRKNGTERKPKTNTVEKTSHDSSGPVNLIEQIRTLNSNDIDRTEHKRRLDELIKEHGRSQQGNEPPANKPTCLNR